MHVSRPLHCAPMPGAPCSPVPHLYRTATDHEDAAVGGIKLHVGGGRRDGGNATSGAARDLRLLLRSLSTLARLLILCYHLPVCQLDLLS